MIFHLHTPELGGTMVYSDYVPRIGELLRMPPLDIEEGTPGRPGPLVGIFQIEDVMYSVPFDVHQRIDVYALKVGDDPADLSYSNVQQMKYEHELSVISERRKKISG